MIRHCRVRERGRARRVTCRIVLSQTAARASSPLPGRSGVVLRNAPTVINAGLQAGSFADLRTAYLEDQVTAVLGNAMRCTARWMVLPRNSRTNPDYRQRFAAAFGTSGDSTVTGTRLRTAIAAYVRSLSRLDSRFDRHVRGDSVALTAAERLGFNVFMGKGRCATCHFLPLFNGSVPPAYQETDVEVLGVPSETTRFRDRCRYRPSRNHPCRAATSRV